jgi:MFS family permease
MLGQERTVLPLLADQVFGLQKQTAALTFIAAFGLAKAAANYTAGALSDRHGRRPVLLAGWLVALPVPFLLIWAPTWSWVVGANLLLGVSQGLTWSTTVVMKIDLVGPSRRGLAMGLNEAAGYGAVAATALATGYIAAHAGLRPEPFYLGVAFAALGLGLSAFAVRETHGHAHAEAGAAARAVTVAAQGDQAPSSRGRGPFDREVFAATSWREPTLSAASQAGLVNNLNDGLAWGLFPVLFTTAGLSLVQVAWLAAAYPAVWGLGQVLTGALSDRWGRKGLIVSGMLLQGGALAWVAAASSFSPWLAAVVLLGAGTAMVYPTLLAAIGDVAHPSWRARSVGVYRLWRDGGFAVGALVSGVVADLAGIRTAILLVAGLTAASGLVVALRMSRRPEALPVRTSP